MNQLSQHIRELRSAINMRSKIEGEIESIQNTSEEQKGKVVTLSQQQQIALARELLLSIESQNLLPDELYDDSIVKILVFLALGDCNSTIESFWQKTLSHKDSDTSLIDVYLHGIYQSELMLALFHQMFDAPSKVTSSVLALQDPHILVEFVQKKVDQTWAETGQMSSQEKMDYLTRWIQNYYQTSGKNYLPGLDLHKEYLQIKDATELLPSDVLDMNAAFVLILRTVVGQVLSYTALLKTDLDDPQLSQIYAYKILVHLKISAVMSSLFLEKLKDQPVGSQIDQTLKDLASQIISGFQF